MLSASTMFKLMINYSNLIPRRSDSSKTKHKKCSQPHVLVEEIQIIGNKILDKEVTKNLRAIIWVKVASSTAKHTNLRVP